MKRFKIMRRIAKKREQTKTSRMFDKLIKEILAEKDPKKPKYKIQTMSVDGRIDKFGKDNLEYWKKVQELNTKYYRMHELQNEYNRMMFAGISPRSDEVRVLVAEILKVTNECGGW